MRDAEGRVLERWFPLTQCDFASAPAGRRVEKIELDAEGLPVRMWDAEGRDSPVSLPTVRGLPRSAGNSACATRPIHRRRARAPDRWKARSTPVAHATIEHMVHMTIEMPEEALASVRKDPTAFVRELRLAAAVKWYELGEVSQGRAAEIAGISRQEFVLALGRYRVSPFQYSPEEASSEAGRE